MKQVNSDLKFKIPQQFVIEDERKKSYPIPKEKLDELKQRNKEQLLFSFRFLDREHIAFNLGSMGKRNVSICGEWFITLLDSLKEVCNINRNELIGQRQHYDAHEHDWKELDYQFEFDKDFLQQVECMQFRLSKSDGRVHGFIIGNRFYIVWLDPYHNLYPDEKYGGRKFYQKPLTCFEQQTLTISSLYNENLKLKCENKDLMKILDIKTS